jgi:glutaredoxin 2
MKLYIYDHCPYCVKARMIFGLKSVAVELVSLLNDDEATPIRMIGQKMVPILEKPDGSRMPESMDIVHYIDGLDGDPMVRPGGEPRLSLWLEASRRYVSALAMPRWVDAPLEEFATDGARQYFTRKKETVKGPFTELRARTPELLAEANAHLKELAPLVQSPHAVHGVTTEDDFHLFAALRSLSIVSGVVYPPKVEAYRQEMSGLSGVPLHDAIAR